MQILIEKFLRSKDSHQYKLNVADRMVLVILASYMGINNECWPSYRTLQKDTGIGSQSTISQSLKKLNDLHFLRIEEHFKKNNKYYFQKPFLDNLLHICSRVLQIRSRPAPNMERNNIKNNNNNNCVVSSNVETQSTSYKKMDIKPLSDIGLRAKDEAMEKVKRLKH